MDENTWIALGKSFLTMIGICYVVWFAWTTACNLDYERRLRELENKKKK